MPKVPIKSPSLDKELKIEHINHIYIYSCHEDEKSLCALEMRAFFGVDSQTSILESPLKIDLNRSPFIQERIDVIYEGNSLEDIIEQIKDLQLFGSTFKVTFVKNRDIDKAEKVRFEERRKLEREVGLHIAGEADLQKPDLIFGIANVNGRWLFGEYFKNKAIWLSHKNKPNSYSTALSARLARAVVNIAIPNPTGIKAIDPCCGIGTVLVEGLSMGIDIVGSDINPLVLPGARENIAYYGLVGKVVKMDILDVTDNYDVAIIDMPYNLCSVITYDEQLKMLESTRRFAKRVVIITIEEIDSIINKAGFSVIDRCIVKKGKLNRHIMVCE